MNRFPRLMRRTALALVALTPILGLLLVAWHRQHLPFRSRDSARPISDFDRGKRIASPNSVGDYVAGVNAG